MSAVTGEPEMPAARPARRGLRRLVAALVAVGLVVAATVLAWTFSVERYEQNLSHVPGVIDPGDKDRPAKPAGVRAENWLVVGSDSRAAGGNGNWRPGAQRSDTLMLVHLAGDGQQVLITSIPRDTWVSIPGHGMAKINAAFSFGGPRLLVRTVERLTKVRIDHYAAIDFAGFKAMTDAVGGVDVTVPETVYDKANQKRWQKGRHHLDGEEALLYVRQRYGLPGGDLDRIQRQQTFLLALLGKVRSRGTLTKPLRLDAFLDATTKAVAIDDTLSDGELRSLVIRHRGVTSDDLSFETVPILGSGRRDGQSVLFLDEDRADRLFTAIRTDQIEEYVGRP